MATSPTKLQRFVTKEAGRRLARAVARRFHAEIHGEEHVPREGPVLLVGNHAIYGIDAVPLAALLALRTGRVPRFLGERSLWKVPLLSPVLDALGIVLGEPDAAVELLGRGELVCVYPGGVLDSFKLSSEAYTLKWKDRAGFARVAMRAGAPIVPFAGTGVDELFDVHKREACIGRRWLGSERYDFPIPDNLIPHPVPLDYYLLPPIDTSGNVDNPRDVERVRKETHDAIDGVLRGYRQRMRR